MGKQPSFQFYPGDWIQDTRILTPLTRGIWIDMLCFMWRSSERGKLEMTIEQYARLLSCQHVDISNALEELTVTKIADVTKCNNAVTVINRRMYREEKERKSTRHRVAEYRKRKCNNTVTVPSSSSSSCTKVHTKVKGDFFDLPDGIKKDTWEAYLQMRRQIKKPASQKAQDLIVQKLLKMGGDMNAILEQSIMNSWQGIFPLKTDGGGNGTNIRNDARPWIRRPGEDLSPDAQQAIADAQQAGREALARRAANRAPKDT